MPNGNDELRGRKQVRIRIRPNLQFTLHSDSSQAYYVVKDPVSRRYFRFDEGQRFVMGLMDGGHTLADIQKAYELKFRPERLSLEELELFAAHLVETGLAQGESSAADMRVFAQEQDRRRRQRWLAWVNIFCWRIPLVRDDRCLDALVPVARHLLRPWFLGLALLALLSAVALLLGRWSEFLARLPATQEYFSFHFLLYLAITLGLAKTLHELGHALCCKALGGEVHEIGVMLLFFFPTLYCDVSDCWTLPGKWKRIAISAAGIVVELWLASLAVFLWWLTAEETLLHHLAFALMLVCSVHTVFCNANPLLRFDGYYILCDWLEVPNLAQQSGRFLEQTCWRALGADVADERPVGRCGPRFLVAYALSSLAYRYFVWGTALFLLYQFCKRHQLASLGMMLVVAGVAALLAGPVHGVARTLCRPGGVPAMKRARLVLAGAMVVGMIVVVCVIPWPAKIRGLALVQADPDHVRRVVAPESGGFLKEINVQDGQAVRRGDILAVLVNPELDMKLRVNEAEQGLKRQQQLALVGQLAEAWNSEEDGHFALLADFEHRALLQQHASLSRQAGRLTLRAPCDGVVMGLRSVEEKGKWLDKGTELCHVGNPGALRAIMLLDAAEHGLLARGRHASFAVHGGGGRSWHGVVMGLSSLEAKHIPPQLALRSGGEVATDKDPLSQHEKPRLQHFQVAVRIPDNSDLLHPGVMGRLKIEVASQTLWTRLRLLLARTVR
jgi:putative peptide zinc metalloprotease protein